MSPAITIRTTLAICGHVWDAVTAAPIADAVVTIVAGPPAFEARRAIRSSLPGWESSARRLDRTRTRVDGRFVFVNLPEGDYTLKVGARRRGGRYGDATLTLPAGVKSDPVAVFLQPAPAIGVSGGSAATPHPPASGGNTGSPPANEPRRPAPIDQGDGGPAKGLGEASRIFGRVARRSSRRPVAGARVQVRGTQLGAHTDADGRYAIEGLPPGPATVEIVDERFEPAHRHVNLLSGKDRRLNILLRRRPPQKNG